VNDSHAPETGDAPFDDFSESARAVASDQEATIRDRWLSAICYLSFLVFIPIFAKSKSPFLARHCRQGFVLFFTEVVAYLLLLTIESTLGRIPILGFLLTIILYLAAGLLFLAISVIGFMKAVAGDSWRLAFFDEFADKIPIR
jgi:uncharacterized membrane protein